MQRAPDLHPMTNLGRSPRSSPATTHRFSLEGDFMERLEGRERREAIPQDVVASKLSCSRGCLSADLGAGIGYFTFPLAKRAGRVIAIDIEPKMLEVISMRIAEHEADNIAPVRGEITATPLADSSMDHVLAAFVYHEVGSQQNLLRECARILRSSGRLDLLDFQKCETSFGPPVSDRKTPEHVIGNASNAFKLESRFETDVFYQLSFSKK